MRAGVTLLIFAGACLLALLTILPATRGLFPFWIAGAGLHIADTMTHEMGHTIAAWLFGRPAIPMIFTLFGANQAGGMSLYWEHSWAVQIAAFAVMAYGCYWLRENWPGLFVPALAGFAAIIAIILSGHQTMVIAFMGHGGAILAGGYLLFRVMAYPRTLSVTERFLSALFGFFMIFSNIAFSYALRTDADLRDDYSDSVIFGITHNDFAVIAEMMPGWSVRGVCLFTIMYALAVLLIAAIAAFFVRDNWEERT